jgi:hypothetical protein
MLRRWRSRRSATSAEATTTPAAPTTRRVFGLGGGVGNRIQFDGPPPGQVGATAVVYGWKPTTPAPGDYLTGRLRDGRDAIARFLTVSPYSDPPDMFRATVQLVGTAPSDRLIEHLQQLEPTATIVAG